MKLNKYLVAAIVVIVGIIGGIAVLGSAGGGQDYMDAVVVNINEDTIDVEVLNNVVSEYSAIEGVKNVTVSTDVKDTKGVPDLAIGDQVRIVYNRESINKETMTIETVFSIYAQDELKTK